MSYCRTVENRVNPTGNLPGKQGSRRVFSGGIVKIIYTAALTSTFLLSTPVLGHHSPSVYDLGSVLTLQGTVRRYEWKNPHVYIYVEVEGEPGSQPVEWELEGGSTPLMARGGWTDTTLASGDTVSARVNPNKNATTPNAWLLAVSKEDGTSVTRWSTNGASNVPANDISGVWDGLRGFQELSFFRGELTERGAAGQANYDESQNPVKDCIAAPVPMLTYMPYRSEIEVRDDEVLIKSEYFSVERIVYMDGRGHPEAAERTNQGHSIGHWDGDSLVVDTALFTDSPTGNSSGVPSGAQKHVTEKFTLSESRTQLKVEFSFEDPEFMAEPSTGEVALDHVPDREMLPFECELESARRYTLE